MREFVAVALLAGALTGCGAGDGVVTGVGNGGNRFYGDSVLDQLRIPSSSRLTISVSLDVWLLHLIRVR